MFTVEKVIDALYATAYQGTSNVAGKILHLWKGTITKDVKGSHYVLEIPFPGIKKENINLNLVNRLLMAEGLMTDSSGRKAQYVYQAPKEVDLNCIMAEYEDGVLTVTLPYSLSKEIVRTRKIEIK